MQLEVNNQNNDPAARLMAQKYIMYENKKYMIHSISSTHPFIDTHGE